jgi:hypothetical protein
MEGQLRAVATLAALALAVSGCGDDDDSADRGPVRTTPVVGQGLPPEVRHPVTAAIDRLQRAFAARDYRRLCADVTPAAARDAGEAAHGDATTCERDLRRLFDLVREGGGWRHVGRPRVTDVRVEGASAVATVALDRRWRARAWLTRRDGRWRLSGLFGTPLRLAERAGATIEDASFPPAGDGLTAADATGSPCPALSAARYPELAGGCRIRLRTRIVPLTILTPFGDFEFSRCSLDYSVRVGPDGSTWTEDFEVEGGAPGSEACGDVNGCYDQVAESLLPWRGRLRPSGDGEFVHETDMCLRTCVGYFVGKLRVRLVEEDDGWRAEPIDGGGETGIRFNDQLAVQGDLRLQAG